MKRNPWYWTCPDCGANLDHGEKCDCSLLSSTAGGLPSPMGMIKNAATQAGPLRSGWQKNICKAIIA